MSNPIPPSDEQGGAFTLRISSLSSLSRCPGFTLASLVEDRDSKAADTGSLAGRIIQLWHENGEDPIAYQAACDQALREYATEWPLADVNEAIRVTTLYACDERNYGVVLKGSCEREVALTLDPAPEDPTGLPIRLVGHLDQIRRDPRTGLHYVWDIKNGAQPGIDMLYSYCWQLAGYALAATEVYGFPVLPGGIIRLQAYGVKCKPNEAKLKSVFFEANWSLEACKVMLATAVQHIAWLRSGLVHLQPGVQCAWCSAGGPSVCSDYIASKFPNGVSLT